MLCGSLKKMRVVLDTPVEYFLPVGEQELPLNHLLGSQLTLRFTGKIECQHCGRLSKKSFSQGYCYPCMISLAQCDLCIMKPETCHFHLGTCREPEWGEKNCFVPHYVYLSNTSGLKVGITRFSQLPTRWIDQGAAQAMTLFEVKSRYQSGLIEVIFKDLVSDRTSWQALLKGQPEPRDLVFEASKLKSILQQQLERQVLQFPDGNIDYLNTEPVAIDYPVLHYPTKIKSHNFDKNPLVEGVFLGIKGQYLIFDTGVINIRKFTAYEVEVTL